MGGLRKPQMPAGSIRDLFDALHALHHRAGWPSLRTIAREVGCSHTTVSSAFAGPALPRWGLLELIVEALNGDVAAFHRLWLAAGSAGEAADAAGTDATGTDAAGTEPATGPATDAATNATTNAATNGTMDVTATVSTATVSTATPVVPHQLPGDVPAFTGRAEQLAALDRLVHDARSADSPVVICAVSGTAGVGKPKPGL